MLVRYCNAHYWVNLEYLIDGAIIEIKNISIFKGSFLFGVIFISPQNIFEKLLK